MLQVFVQQFVGEIRIEGAVQCHKARQANRRQLDVLRHHKEIGEHLGCSVGNVMRPKTNGSPLWVEQAGHEIE